MQKKTTFYQFKVSVIFESCVCVSTRWKTELGTKIVASLNGCFNSYNCRLLVESKCRYSYASCCMPTQISRQ